MAEQRQVALIVGGGTGIGYATAERLIRRGCPVALSGRRESVLAEAADRLRALASDAQVETIAVDVADRGIQANAVAPGWIHTAMVDDFVRQATPESLKRLNILGRVGDPDEVANVVEYLALDAPAYLTGTTIFVDGGQTAMAPL